MMPGAMQRSVKWMRGLMLRHMPLMITCRQFEGFLLAYLEGELPDRQRFVFELHLKLCRECRDYLAAYRRTIEVSQQALEDPDGPLPEAVPEDLIKAVLAARDA